MLQRFFAPVLHFHNVEFFKLSGYCINKPSTLQRHTIKFVNLECS